ncbi:low temperature requirement protein LtrA [Catenulispora sp. GP43]|uniref:low temperature requirement protein A n=1 Tax=Catenulispora sp. GP43 TaxID=3156263 RepID=UPI0035198DA3
MLQRDPDEENRTSTNLELFFDLVFVVSISAVAQQWRLAISGGRLASGLLHFVLAMFAVWWAWMGFTWFANFFDVDDVPYRLTVLVQLLGSLGLAAGVAPMFKSYDIRIIVGSYVVIRIAMAAQWLRAARANPQLAVFCRRWASGILLAEAWWVVVGFTSLPHFATVPLFLVGAAAEVFVPLWATRVPIDSRPTTHGEHVQERYGLFTLIVLGETVLTASTAFNTGLRAPGRQNGHVGVLILGALSAAVLAFALWWLYFGFLGTYNLQDRRISFIWGYGHYVVFGILTALGGSLAAMIADLAAGQSSLPEWEEAMTLSVPVALFLTSIAMLRRVSASASCNRWFQGGAAVVTIGTLGGLFGTIWALVSVCITTTVFLALAVARSSKQVASQW